MFKRLAVCILLVCTTSRHYGEANRFLPMIVWDHINPQLTCKSNWLIIPKIDAYDNLRFVCPSVDVGVTVLNRIYPRRKNEMNENIFMRKWSGSKTDLTELKEALLSGSFCDPEKSLKLFTCKNGQKGKSLPVFFIESDHDPKKNYSYGDMVVFFNNGNDGRNATLSNKTSHCSMVFIVDITWTNEAVYDLSYGKCFNPPANICNKINASSLNRGKDVIATRPPSPKPSTEPSIAPSIAPCRVLPPVVDVVSAKRVSDTGSILTRLSLFTGIVIGLLIAVICLLVYYGCLIRQLKRKCRGNDKLYEEKINNGYRDSGRVSDSLLGLSGMI